MIREPAHLVAAKDGIYRRLSEHVTRRYIQTVQGDPPVPAESGSEQRSCTRRDAAGSWNLARRAVTGRELRLPAVGAEWHCRQAFAAEQAGERAISPPLTPEAGAVAHGLGEHRAAINDLFSVDAGQSETGQATADVLFLPRVEIRGVANACRPLFNNFWTEEPDQACSPANIGTNRHLEKSPAENIFERAS